VEQVKIIIYTTYGSIVSFDFPYPNFTDEEILEELHDETDLYPEFHTPIKSHHKILRYYSHQMGIQNLDYGTKSFRPLQEGLR
jgi:hypothetical protein